MSRRPPLVDDAVSKSAALGPLGLLLVIAVLGLVILGARTVSSRLRGLDQDAPATLSGEGAAAPESTP